MRIGFILFDGFTNLDFSGPYEVLARLPGVEVALIAKKTPYVQSDLGLRLIPNATFITQSKLDILVVPGGPGVNKVLCDREILSFVEQVSSTAKYVTSVCTGALILGAAGLLKGRRATTHWMARDFLASFGAEVVAQRVVIDGHIITAAGVSAGIDFAFMLAEKISDRITVERIQLWLEYDPDPPLNAGSPQQAGAEMVAAVKANFLHISQERAIAVAQAVERLSSS